MMGVGWLFCFANEYRSMRVPTLSRLRPGRSIVAAGTTVPAARFTPRLRVALPFGQVPTGHTLPSGALPHGKEPLGWLCLGGGELIGDWVAAKTMCSRAGQPSISWGGRPVSAQPPAGPHRDGSERRQIPRPFLRRERGHTAEIQLAKK